MNRKPMAAIRDVVLYGLCGGLLIAALRLADYRFLVIEHAVRIYGALIAALFAGLGIWLGLTARRTRIVVREVPVPTERPGPGGRPIRPERRADPGAGPDAAGAGDPGAHRRPVVSRERRRGDHYLFTEPFPIGLLVTAISASVLRRKKPVVPARSC
jgi:hypothetical protein